MALYLVGTPIGNLEDISLRALRVLREVRLIAAEDTRTTRKLLSHYSIKTPLTSFFQHSRPAKLDRILEAAAVEDVALVSEAGMPGISDPGYEVVTAALERQIEVIPVPGPSAALTALAISGLPSDRFLYLGFLPRTRPQRCRLLRSLADESATLVAFEAPHRLQASLQDLAQTLGDRRVAVARELTKLYEEVYRGTIRGAIEHFTQPRGEFTLVVEGNRAGPAAASADEVRRRLAVALAEGLGVRAAAARVAQETGWQKREVYALASRLGKRGGVHPL
jgi:16S rRNA (cytidine1402-2'-O)-methyltransferase